MHTLAFLFFEYMEYVVKIPLSKTKLVKYFIGSLLFVFAGFLFITNPHWFIKADDPTIIKWIGYASVVFFGACAIFISQKLFDKKPGLIIDEEGITDNSSGVSAGKILWKDVKEISEHEVMGQKFIMLRMKNPEFYLQREKDPIKRRMMELNYKLYGTPINIAANGLKISFGELYTLIMKTFVSNSNPLMQITLDEIYWERRSKKF